MIKVKDVLNELEKNINLIVECITIRGYYVTGIEISLNKIILIFNGGGRILTSYDIYRKFRKIINDPRHINHNIYINFTNGNTDYPVKSGAVNSISVVIGYLTALDFKIE